MIRTASLRRSLGLSLGLLACSTGTTDEGGSGDDAAEEGGSGGGPADEADRAGPAEPTDPDEGDSWTGIVLSPWLVGGAAFLVILLVLLRSLRPR